MPSEAKWAISLLAGAGLLWIGWKFFFVLVTLHVIVCFVLMAVILLQGGEAADLAGAFGGSGSQTAFGPRAAATFLSMATTWCAIMFMFTTMSLVLRESSSNPGAAGSSVLEKTSQPAKQAPAPFGAQPAPAQGTPTTPPGGAQPPQAQPQPAPAKQTPPPKK